MEQKELDKITIEWIAKQRLYLEPDLEKNREYAKSIKGDKGWIGAEYMIKDLLSVLENFGYVVLKKSTPSKIVIRRTKIGDLF